MFIKENFCHVSITGTKPPRLFSYYHADDTLKTIMKAGYFNTQKILLKPNSFIKVVCKDAIAEIVVEDNIKGDITMRDEYILAHTTEKWIAKPPVPKSRKRTKAKPKLAKAG